MDDKTPLLSDTTISSDSKLAYPHEEHSDDAADLSYMGRAAYREGAFATRTFYEAHRLNQEARIAELEGAYRKALQRALARVPQRETLSIMEELGAALTSKVTHDSTP